MSKLQILRPLVTDLSLIPSLMKGRAHQYSLVNPKIWQLSTSFNDVYQKSLEKHFSKNGLGYIHKTAEKIDGMITAKVIMPPSVYSSGLTCFIEDFCISDENSWNTIGLNLLKKICHDAQALKSTQVVLVSPNNDHAQQNFFKSIGLSNCSQWWTGEVPKGPKSSDIDYISKEHIHDVVSLSYHKRFEYSKVQPLFWKMAHNSNAEQAEFFDYVIQQKQKYIPLLHFNNGINGFIIGDIGGIPEHFKPKKICKVDDFALKSPKVWDTIGKSLLLNLSLKLPDDVEQFNVVCGAHDVDKKKILADLSLKLSYNWWTAPLDKIGSSTLTTKANGQEWSTTDSFSATSNQSNSSTILYQSDSFIHSNYEVSCFGEVSDTLCPA